MRNGYGGVCLLAVLSACAPAAGAADFAEAGSPWPEDGLTTERIEAAPASDYSENSLAGVYLLALENDKTLAAARATYRAGLEERALGRAALLPRADASYGTVDTYSESRGQFPAGGTTFPSNTDTNADTDRWSINLEQPLFDLTAWFRFRRGQELSEQAQSQFTVAQQDLIARTAEAYFAVLRARANLQASRAEESAVEAQLDQVKQRFDVGLVAITDVHEAQAAYDLAVAERLEDEGDVRVALEELSVLTGQSHAQLWQLRDDFPVVDPEPSDVDDWVRFACEHNADIELAGDARDVARKSARAAQSEHLPTLNFTATFSDAETSVNQDDLDTGFTTEFDQNNRQNQFAINLTMPLYTGGSNSANRRQAWAQYESEAETYAATVRDVTQQTRAFYISVVRDVARTRARERAITSSRSALEAAETGYEVGTRNVVDVLDAQRNLFSAIRDHSNSIIDYVLDVVALKRRAGTLTPTAVFELNRWLEKPPPPSKRGNGDGDGLLPLPALPEEEAGAAASEPGRTESASGPAGTGEAGRSNAG